MSRITRTVCLLWGHRWKRERHPDGNAVLLTCKRCGKVDAVDQDMGGKGLGWGAFG